MKSSAAIPFFSTRVANAGLDFRQPLERVLNSHWFILGEEVKSFELEFAKYIGVEDCISVANGSEALELALRALQVGPGDEVLAVANAGFYSSIAIHAVGATPVYVDINPELMTMCPQAMASAITPKTKAIIATHLYGQLAEIEQLVNVATNAGVALIEDCAQCHGARLGDRMAGSFGAMACFSFYPTKNLGALGDGGAVVTRDPSLASRLRSLRQYGWGKKYEVVMPAGRNSRMDELQAALLRLKLPYLDAWNQQRREIADRYTAAFADLELTTPALSTPQYVAHLYVVRVQQRHALAAMLASRQISSDVHYPIADHQQPAYLLSRSVSLPYTEAACDTVLSLPCFPGLTMEEVDRVIAAVREFFSAKE